MNILIIEDEPLVARDIEKLITKLEPEATVLAVLTSIEGARNWFARHAPPDLILSDIQLSDGVSFEIFENLGISSSIIFTTAYDDYAIRAFKLNSIDYLLKPIDANELKAALTKYKSLSNQFPLGEQMRSILQGLSANKAYKDRFLAIQGNAMVPVSVGDISYFQKDHLIFLFNMNNDKFICEFQALDDVEELLDPTTFFRVNRQYLVHIQSVGKVKTTHKGLTISLKSPMSIEIDISREKASAFKKWLD